MTVDAQTELAPTLEGRYYTDPAIMAAECERIFERQWYYAGRADESPRLGSSSGARSGAKPYSWSAARTT